MRNAGKPAFHKILRDDKEFEYKNSGLTKREIFAMAAMQGVVAGFDAESKANGCYIPASEYPELMKQCVQIADELLKQLEL